MKPKVLGRCVAMIGMWLGLIASAAAQDTRTLMDEIQRLRRDVDVLQRSLATGRPAASGATTSGAPPSEGFIGQTEARFAQIEAQQREQTGKIEEVQFRLRQLEQKLDKLIADVEFRFNQLERGGAAPQAAVPDSTRSATPQPSSPGETRLVIQPSGTSAQAVGRTPGTQAAVPAPTVTLPNGPPEAQYEFAYRTLLQAQRDQRDFASAEAALRAFVDANSNHRLAGNAQYWLGETFFVRRDWQNAAIAFGEGLKRYPSSDKAPDNMLKLGMSLAQLNRKADACGALSEVDRRYPQAQAAVKQSAQRERQRLAC